MMYVADSSGNAHGAGLNIATFPRVHTYRTSAYATLTSGTSDFQSTYSVKPLLKISRISGAVTLAGGFGDLSVIDSADETSGWLPKVVGSDTSTFNKLLFCMAPDGKEQTGDSVAVNFIRRYL